MKNSLALAEAAPQPSERPARQFDSFAQRLIRHKARQLVGKYGFTASDREDLEQELWLQLLERLQAKGDQVANREAFIVTVLNRQVADLIRRRRAGKRNAERLRSLNALIQDEDDRWVQLGERIPEDQQWARHQIAPSSDQERVELRQDVTSMLAELPLDLRDLCERLQHFSVSAVARQLGMPRRTLRDAIARLRQHFVAAGLDESVGILPPGDREIASEEAIDGHSNAGRAA